MALAGYDTEDGLVRYTRRTPRARMRTSWLRADSCPCRGRHHQEEVKEEEEEEEEEVERKGAAPAKSRTHVALHTGGAGAHAAQPKPAGDNVADGGSDGTKGQTAAASASMATRENPAAPLSSKAAREALLLAPVNKSKKNTKSKMKS